MDLTDSSVDSEVVDVVSQRFTLQLCKLCSDATSTLFDFKFNHGTENED